MSLIKYILHAVFLWVALHLGFGKIPPSEINRRKLQCSAFDHTYKPKKKRKNSDQWGKRYFKNK